MSDQGRWTITDHCCRICAGRILERSAGFMCADCEARASLRPNAICGCGMKAQAGRDLPLALRGAFRCGVNPARGPQNPARICILFCDGSPVPPLEAK